MKVFFLGSRTPELYPTYKMIIESLKNQGHVVFDEWMKLTNQDDAKNFEQAYKRNMDWIKRADILVTEISEPSSGVSFLIASALNEKKPVLALYNTSESRLPPSTIRGSSKTNRLLMYIEYSEKNLDKTLHDYLIKIKATLDTKFILIISPSIDHYLQWVSENRRMHKAQVVRLALEEEMEKDKEYKDYIRKGK